MALADVIIIISREGGALVAPAQSDRRSTDPQLLTVNHDKAPQGMAIDTGALRAHTVVPHAGGGSRPNQKKLLTNARTVQAGGEADPPPGRRGRKALLAS